MPYYNGRWFNTAMQAQEWERANRPSYGNTKTVTTASGKQVPVAANTLTPYGWQANGKPTTAGATSTATAAPGTPQSVMDSYQKAQNEAKAANETRYNDMLTKQAEASAALGGGYRDLLTKTGTDWTNLINDQNRDYTERERQGMGMLEGINQQAASDVRQDWGARDAATQAQMNTAGLGNTTVGASMRMGNEREKQKDLRRLTEDTMRTKFGAYEGLSGDRIRADAAGKTGMLSDLGRVGENAVKSNYGSSQDLLGIMERRNDTYPDMSQYLALMQGMGEYGGGGGGGNMGGGGAWGGAVNKPAPYTLVRTNTGVQAGLYPQTGSDPYARYNDNPPIRGPVGGNSGSPQPQNVDQMWRPSVTANPSKQTNKPLAPVTGQQDWFNKVGVPVQPQTYSPMPWPPPVQTGLSQNAYDYALTGDYSGFESRGMKPKNYRR
jgi:hypothetical protein